LLRLQCPRLTSVQRSPQTQDPSSLVAIPEIITAQTQTPTFLSIYYLVLGATGWYQSRCLRRRTDSEHARNV